MSIDSRPDEYYGTRFPSCPLASGSAGERVRVRGSLIELILGRDSPQTKMSQHHSKPPSP